MKHKHSDLIKLWADGTEIQSFCPDKKEWVDNKAPSWTSTTEYRLKPKAEFLSYKVALCKSCDTGKIFVATFEPDSYICRNLRSIHHMDSR